jgi:hypothetical protein
MLQRVFGGLKLHLATSVEKAMFTTEQTTALLGLKCPSEADCSCWNTIDIFRAQDSSGRHSNISRAVVQRSQGHLSGDLTAGEVEGLDGVWIDT